MPRRIRIKPMGGTANRTLQYMLAVAIGARLEGVEIFGAVLPEWRIQTPSPPDRQSFGVVMGGHVLPLPLVLELAAAVQDIDINLAYAPCRLIYFRDLLDTYRSLLRPGKPYREGYDERHLVIHVRGDNVLLGQHPNYFPLPLAWYRELIERSGLRPVFVGQLRDDIYAPALRAAFPTAEFVTGDDPMADFHLLRTSTHVVLAISTFSWLAAWLSERAETICLPVAGIFNPGGRPQIDMLPLEDRRYRFFLSRRTAWRGTPQEMAAIIDGGHDLREEAHAAVAHRFAPQVGTYGYRPAAATIGQ